MKEYTKIMDSTRSNWMRFVLMTGYAKKLERERDFLKVQLTALKTQKETLYSMLMR